MPHHDKIGALFAGMLLNLPFRIAFICFDDDVYTARFRLLRYAGQLRLQPLLRRGGIIERISLGLSFGRSASRHSKQDKLRSNAFGQRYCYLDGVFCFRSAVASHNDFFEDAAHRGCANNTSPAALLGNYQK